MSLPAFVTFTVGVGMWIAYGVLQNHPPIIFWNAVTMVLAAAIVAMKLRYG